MNWRAPLIRLAAWLMRRRYVGRAAYRLTREVGVPEMKGSGVFVRAGLDLAKGHFILAYEENGKTRIVNPANVKWNRYYEGYVFYD